MAGEPELRVSHGVSRYVVPQSNGRDGDEDEIGGVQHRPGRNSCLGGARSWRVILAKTQSWYLLGSIY